MNIKILVNLLKIINNLNYNLINKQHKVIVYKNGDILINFHKIYTD